MTLFRLSADRFYTVDFTMQVYTRTGMEWIKKERMASVLLAHYGKELGGVLDQKANPFQLEQWG